MAWARGFARRRRGRFGLGGALAGLAAGAGLAFFLDPVRGPARRARTLDRARRAAHEAERTAESRARDLGHRARGAAHEARARVEREHVADEVLVERVRARLGRLVAHPHAIEVAAREGRVELSGDVFRAEHARLLRGVRLVRGIRGLEDRLRPHDDATGVAALQGRGPLRAGAGVAWPAGTAVVAVAVGSAVAARAVLGRRLLGIPALVAGAALARGAAHGSLSRSRHGRRVREERAADRARVHEQEEEREREAHSGAWHPEPEVREVKSPAELEAGIAHASPAPTFPDRVSRRGGEPRPRERRRTPGANELPDPSVVQPMPRAGFVSPPAGSGVHEGELGGFPGPDEEAGEGDGEGGDEG